MVKTYWITDMHLDSCSSDEFKKFLKQIEPGSNLIISGDISNSYRLESDLNSIGNGLVDRCQIYFVLGNHDFYGSYINEVRRVVAQFIPWQGNLHYLSDYKSPIYCNIGKENWAIVGIDGWADARAGHFDMSPDLIRDYKMIHDFTQKNTDTRRRFLNKLGEEEAFKLEQKLNIGVLGDNVLIVTHVPPYPEAHIYEGQPASNAYLPHFVCVATGEVISDYALKHKDKNIHIICGHTHQECDVKIMDNITVHVGYANYSELLCVDLDKVLDGKN